jgi:23S rRNA (cytidine1920-2'-O)/16S rRNA (cytidine1409-2'-O)-methyltransferase
MRLDQALVTRKLVASRSQAESYIKLGVVTVNGQPATKVHQSVTDQDVLQVTIETQYVSRAALKLASVSRALQLDFRGRNVMDVGSSTGGFTDYALQHGATKVIAVEVGTNQLHPRLRHHPRIELHEQTDIRDLRALSTPVDIVVIDVSFISLRQILPAISKLVSQQTQIVAMVKPQFEAGDKYKHKGVIKNDAMRREILKSFETWVKQSFVVTSKADSEVYGSQGNQERFYVLQKLP